MLDFNDFVLKCNQMLFHKDRLSRNKYLSLFFESMKHLACIWNLILI